MGVQSVTCRWRIDMRRFPYTVFAALATLVVIASTCSRGGSNNDNGEGLVDIDGTTIALTSELSGFADCDALLDHLHAEAADRVGPYGLEQSNYGGGRFGDGIAETATEDSVSAADESASAIQDVDFSGTNIQEIGVDEADIVKTDGERIYLVANEHLIVVDTASREVTGTLQLDSSWLTELFLSNNELLVISATWLNQNEGGNDSGVRIRRVTIDAGQPRELESVVLEGDYVSSRSVGGVARVIVRTHPQHSLGFVYPEGSAGEDIARNANRAAVEQSSLADWLPSLTRFDSGANQVGEPVLPDCGSVHAPTEFAGFGVLSVLNIPVGGELAAAATTSVLAPGDLVYASTESIFVATQNWFGPIASDIDSGDETAWEDVWTARRTSIHQFDLSADGAAYATSGSVPGDILNQFSLSEHDGHLRVVATTGGFAEEPSETSVHVLRLGGDQLVEVGQVGDMGRGETVQSVRLIGNVGYVVTFRQIDPFYTLDLSQPENPLVVGELKIPGFSSYLHPIGSGRVLGVGSDADEDGRVTGSKVSIFDVNDPAHPAEIAVWTAPGGWNDIGWEHRSFLWWEADQIAVIPVSTYDEDQHWAGAVVLQVDGNTITEVGRFDHLESPRESGTTECEQITADDLPSTTPAEMLIELESALASGSELLLLCGEDEEFAAAGFDCYTDPELLEEAQEIDWVIPAGETPVWCWSTENQIPTIARSLIIDSDELWTISSPWGYYSAESPARLQVNDLHSLERLETVDLG